MFAKGQQRVFIGIFLFYPGPRQPRRMAVNKLPIEPKAPLIMAVTTMEAENKDDETFTTRCVN